MIIGIHQRFIKKVFLIFVATGFAISGIAQSVGINTNTPGYPLDVNGRMRLRYNGSFNTAGIWFNNSSNNEVCFTGMFNDTIVGFYGNGNWRAGVDFKNGRLGVGTMTPTAKLEIVGSVKINDGTQAAGKVLTSIDGSGNTSWADPKNYNNNTGFRASVLSAVNVPPSTTYVPISWDASTYPSFKDANFTAQYGEIGLYTAPKTGVYHFEFAVNPDRTQAPTSNGFYTIMIYGVFVNAAISTVPIIANVAYPTNTCSATIKLDAGAVIGVTVSSSLSLPIAAGGLVFSGYMVY